MVNDVSGGGNKSVSRSVNARYLGTMNNRARIAPSKNNSDFSLQIKRYGSSGVGNMRRMSFNEFHQKYSYLYKGKFRGRGTYLKHMSMDWRAMRAGL